MLFAFVPAGDGGFSTSKPLLDQGFWECAMQVMIEPIVRRFVADNFLFQEDAEALSADESLIGGGIIDSTGILELVSFLEQEFNIEIADEDLVPDNLDSLARINEFLARKLGANAGSPNGVNAANGSG
jgi:acyl carrier protein